MYIKKCIDDKLRIRWWKLTGEIDKMYLKKNCLRHGFEVWDVLRSSLGIGWLTKLLIKYWLINKHKYKYKLM